VSGCLGPCDLVNVVCVITEKGQTWLGGLSEFRHYEMLADWVQETIDRNHPSIPLPESLQKFIFQRYS